jgi:16S rRNA (uracil1498-N3)-methyltransferase
LGDGTAVEVFDNEGNVASGTLMFGPGGATFIRVGEVRRQDNEAVRITIASAIPKGERADWMVEKLSELGVTSFIPLAAERSVTLPSGKSKFERWNRIATESAKQSRRVGVMAVESLTTVEELLATNNVGVVLSTESGSKSLMEVLNGFAGEVLLVIGPEGGWTERELTKFSQAGYVAAGLTPSILRTETAAITAAGVVAVSKSVPTTETGTRG